MAHHKPISHQYWQNAQRIEFSRWKGKESLSQALDSLQASYVPLMLKYTENLPQDAKILEIGCGPVCASKLIRCGKKTYVDPLLDNYRRAFPGELPEGELLASMGESIPKPDHSFDCIICLNTLGFVMNPELVLNEVDRLLKPGGMMLIGMTLFSPLEARLHYWLQRLYPTLSPEDRPYCYSPHGIRKTLSRHFEIREDIRVGEKQGLLPGLKRQEHFFVCVRPETKPD
ncbi:MAG TPA: class I SAM-dependent methyltransferase [Mariprofundaceae bacterium]|nr:class I SAM-dependent methyltransferase [Mariprofundaceae bacterium]